MDKGTDNNVQEFISITRMLARSDHFDMQLVDAPTVTYPGSTIEVNGYIVEFPEKKFGVAIRKPMVEWLKVFVHEAGHLDQCIDMIPVWRERLIPGTRREAFDALNAWVERKVEYREEVLLNYMHRARNVEIDCEARAAAKIGGWKLPFDADEYVQQANAYIYFYATLLQTRKWYRTGYEPYNRKEIWSLMPTYFHVDHNDYDVVPEHIAKLYLGLI